MGYNFTAEWLKGSNNRAPDALLGNLVSDPSHKDILAELDLIDQPEVSVSEIRATMNKGHATPHLETLCNIAQDDVEYQQL